MMMDETASPTAIAYLKKHDLMVTSSPDVSKVKGWNDNQLAAGAEIPLVQFGEKVVKNELSPATQRITDTKEISQGGRVYETSVDLSSIPDSAGGHPLAQWGGIRLHVTVGGGQLSVRSIDASSMGAGRSLHIMREYAAEGSEKRILHAWEPSGMRPESDAVDDVQPKVTVEDVKLDPHVQEHRETQTLIKLAKPGEPDQFALVVVSVPRVLDSRPEVRVNIIPIDKPTWVYDTADPTRKIVYETSKREGWVNMEIARARGSKDATK